MESRSRLHLAVTEQRTHWVQPVLAEWDSIYEFTHLRSHLPKRPSEYFATNCFLGASFLSRLECDARGELGANCFMWGADYPHEEGTWPHTLTALRWTFGCGVSTDELSRMLAGNAARCYGLDLRELQPVANRVGPTEAVLRAPAGQLPTSSDDPAARRLSWAFRQVGPWH